MGAILLVVFAVATFGIAATNQLDPEQDAETRRQIEATAEALARVDDIDTPYKIRGGYIWARQSGPGQVTIKSPLRGALVSGGLRVCAHLVMDGTNTQGAFKAQGWRLTHVGQRPVAAPLSEEAAAELCSAEAEEEVTRLRFSRS